jgi:anti-sigma factor RsiW
MHREVRVKLEEILAGTGDALCERHLSECEECSADLAAMREQRGLLRSLRVGGPDGKDAPEQSAGFYARVMERIETQGVVSIWSLFFDSPVGRGLAMASMVVALGLSVYLVSSESVVDSAAEPGTGQVVSHGSIWTAAGGTAAGGESDGMLTGAPDANAVLVNLVTYREQ